MPKIRLSIAVLVLSVAPYLSLQYVNVMGVSLGAFLGEWCYAQGYDAPAKVLNRLACNKGEAISCSLLSDIDSTLR